MKIINIKRKNICIFYLNYRKHSNCNKMINKKNETSNESILNEKNQIIKKCFFFFLINANRECNN